MENEVTVLLQRWGDGEKEALDELVPIVYEELRRAARRYMQGENNHTLQTTALVHEAYLRLIDQKQTRWQNRAHFFGIAATMMRRILVDHARRRKYQKRGGGEIQISLHEAEAFAREDDLNLLKLDEALTGLAKVDARRSRVVELRFFGGLDLEETAEALGVSVATVLRDWNMAKAWLYRYMRDER